MWRTASARSTPTVTSHQSGDHRTECAKIRAAPAGTRILRGGAPLPRRCYDLFVMRLQYLAWAGPRTALFCAAVALAFMGPPSVVHASTSEPTSEQVAAEILRVQGLADEAATRWAEAELLAEDLSLQIGTVQVSVSQASARYSRLQEQLSQIAVDRFTGRSGETILVLGGNAVESMQRDALRAFALDAGAEGLDNVDAVRTDLENHQAHLDALNTENAVLLDDLAASQKELDKQLTELVSLRDRLKDEEVERAYEAQLAAQRKQAEQLAAQEAAALLAAQTAAQSSVRGGGSASVASAASVSPSASPSASRPFFAANASWRCPIVGPNAFGDTWGAPRPGGRRHEGVDMMSPSGTPIVAVVAGNATMRTSERGGNLVSLVGDDGNRYFYGHLSSWEGGSRRVAAGEVIGYVGATGQTTASHLHFEIHPGGGVPVNPYPTVRQHC